MLEDIDGATETWMCSTRGQQAKPGLPIFGLTCEQRMVFTFLNGWNKSTEQYFVMWNLYEIKFQYPNKVLLKHRHTHLFKYYL